MGVILALGLLGGLIMFYCLTSKKTKKVALYCSLAFAVLIIVGYKTPEDYQNPDKFSKEYIRSVEGRGMTLAQVGQIAAQKTPLENGGDFLIALMAMAAIFALAICGDFLGDEDKKYARQIYLKCLGLFVAGSLYLLSLYAGLQLTLFAWIKSKPKEVGEEKNSVEGKNLSTEV